MRSTSSLQVKKPGQNDDSSQNNDLGHHADRNDIEIESPQAVVAGKSISQWTEDWWRWGLQATNNAATNPLLDTNGQAAHFNRRRLHRIVAVQRKIENRRLSGSSLEKTFSHRHAHFVAIGLRRAKGAGRHSIDCKNRY